jgi:two-component system, LuxR family, sensor kinase FixL
MPRMETLWDQRNRARVFLVSAAITLAIALIDWWTKPYVSLGFLYLFPIMLAAGFLPRWAIVLLGAVCAILAELFSSLSRSYTRLSLETLALAGCGLFVAEMVRNRRMSVETQEKLRALVETSPAAIVTVDDRGFIELANRAAAELLAPRDGHLIGNPLAAFLPELHHALRRDPKTQFRASLECQGHKGNGDTFTANVWFSTYREGQSPKLAAIIADVTEQVAQAPAAPEPSDGQMPLNSRESEVLRLLVQGLANKEIAARMSISESAVKNTLQSLFAKSGVRTRSQLVRVALEQYRHLL